MNKILIIASILFIVACSATSKYFDMAEKFEKLNDYESAAKNYIKVYEIEKGNKEAIAGATRNVQNILDSKLLKFDNYFEKKNKIQSYLESKEIDELINDYKNYKINLNIASEYFEKFDFVKKLLADEFYNKGIDAYNLKKWKKAKQYFDKANEVIPGFKDSKKLANQTSNYKNNEKAEKYYVSAIENYNKERFKDAYEYAKQSLYAVPNYKDANKLLKQSQELSQSTFAIVNIKSKSSNKKITDKFYSKLTKMAKNYSSPFINVLNHKDLQGYLVETIPNYFSKNDAKIIGNAAGIDGIVLVEINKLRVNKGKEKRTSKKAYERYYVKNSKGRNTLKGKKVTYYIIENAAEYSISGNYRIIESGTGKVILQDTFSEKFQDKIKYAKYNGDWNQLTSIDLNQKPLNQLFSTVLSSETIQKNLFKERNRFYSEESVVDNLLDPISNKISKRVCRYYHNL